MGRGPESKGSGTAPRGVIASAGLFVAGRGVGVAVDGEFVLGDVGALGGGADDCTRVVDGGGEVDGGVGGALVGGVAAGGAPAPQARNEVCGTMTLPPPGVIHAVPP
jgi:hypothetical protein